MVCCYTSYVSFYVIYYAQFVKRQLATWHYITKFWTSFFSYFLVFLLLEDDPAQSIFSTAYITVACCQYCKALLKATISLITELACKRVDHIVWHPFDNRFWVLRLGLYAINILKAIMHNMNFGYHTISKRSQPWGHKLEVYLQSLFMDYCRNLDLYLEVEHVVWFDWLP